MMRGRGSATAPWLGGAAPYTHEQVRMLYNLRGKATRRKLSRRRSAAAQREPGRQCAFVLFTLFRATPLLFIFARGWPFLPVTQSFSPPCHAVLETGANMVSRSAREIIFLTPS